MHLFTDLSDRAIDGLLGRRTERCLEFQISDPALERFDLGSTGTLHFFARNPDGDTPNPLISTPSEPKFRRVGCAPTWRVRAMYSEARLLAYNGVSFFDLIFPESPKLPGTPFTRELYFVPGPRRLRKQRQAPPSAPRGP